MPTDKDLKKLETLYERVKSLEERHNLDVERLEDRISSLKELINSNIQAAKESSLLSLNASKEAIGAAFAASKEAINKAENAAADKAHDMNQWRATMTDLVTRYMLRNEATDKFETQASLIRDVQTKINDVNSNKHGMTSLWGYIVGAIGLIAMLWDKIK